MASGSADWDKSHSKTKLKSAVVAAARASLTQCSDLGAVLCSPASP